MKPQYRVLLVSDSYAPLIGGADNAVRLLALELSKRGAHDRRGHGLAAGVADVRGDGRD